MAVQCALEYFKVFLDNTKDIPMSITILSPAVFSHVLAEVKDVLLFLVV